MVEIARLRALALGLPDAHDESGSDRLNFSVGGKGFAWTYTARSAPKKPRLPQIDVLAVRCPIERKQMLIEVAPDIFFDDDHYRGYPAVLVRLARVDEAELAALLESARRLQAPKRRPRKA